MYVPTYIRYIARIVRKVPGQTSAATSAHVLYSAATLAQRHYSARTQQRRAIAAQDTAAQNPHYITLQKQSTVHRQQCYFNFFNEVQQLGKIK